MPCPAVRLLTQSRAMCQPRPLRCCAGSAPHHAVAHFFVNGTRAGSCLVEKSGGCETILEVAPGPTHHLLLTVSAAYRAAAGVAGAEDAAAEAAGQRAPDQHAATSFTVQLVAPGTNSQKSVPWYMLSVKSLYTEF